MVEDFIKKRFSADNRWLSGNCLWFSLILKKRFPGGRIYYLPVSGHFVYKYRGKYYDWTGEVYPTEKKVLLSYIKRTDTN